MACLAARACVVFLRRPKAVVKVLRATSLCHPARIQCIVTSAVFNRSQTVAPDEDPTQLTNEEWAKRLTPEQYFVCRERGTEPPFSGQYYSHDAEGLYHCVCCGDELFSSKVKYDSGSGWPSFSEAHKGENSVEGNGSVLQRTDMSHGMVRTEVMCKKCNAHLGHVFDDGPKPTGLRFCINSVSLKFIPKKLSK